METVQFPLLPPQRDKSEWFINTAIVLHQGKQTVGATFNST
jgi:hypothetical protein